MPALVGLLSCGCQPTDHTMLPHAHCANEKSRRLSRLQTIRAGLSDSDSILLWNFSLVFEALDRSRPLSCKCDNFYYSCDRVYAWLVPDWSLSLELLFSCKANFSCEELYSQDKALRRCFAASIASRAFATQKTSRVRPL